jgi:hypothetical protein
LSSSNEDKIDIIKGLIRLSAKNDNEYRVLEALDNEKLAFLGYSCILGSNGPIAGAGQETITSFLNVLFSIEVVCEDCYKIYRFGEAVKLNPTDGSTKVRCPNCRKVKLGTEYR